jgi:SAM-dependent methyltransferase
MGKLGVGLRKAARSVLGSTPVKGVLYMPAVKRTLDHAPIFRQLYRVWDRGHPFDAEYGIETIGFRAASEITSDSKLIPQIVCYAGSQPSIVRTGFKALGPVEDRTLIDFGCGKGRAAIVATEFPFREVLGVELSAELAATARANAAVIGRRFPERPRVTIANANVLEFPLPAGKLAVFAYHPFGAEVLAGVVKNLEAALAGETTHLFFVYDNPVHGDVLDASPAFVRYYSDNVPYDKSELGYGVFQSDAVVIWQSVRGAVPTPYTNVNRKVIVVDGKAELES